MKYLLIWFPFFCFFRSNPGSAQTASLFFNDRDSIRVSGRIIGFKPGDGNDFISFLTFDINGNGRKQAFQVSADGSFNITVYQSFAGDITVHYKTAFASLFVRPGVPLHLEIQNSITNAGEPGKNVFKATGELSEVNNLLFDFQRVFREHDFLYQADLGNKEQTDSTFAANRRKRLEEELVFLNTFADTLKTPNETFIRWQKNQLVYAAGKEILMYPFLGKMNTSITGPQLLEMLGSISISDTSALHNSAYYDFLNMLMLGHQIIVNINPDYAEVKKENGNNPVPVNLAQFDKLTTGITRQILYFNLYVSHFQSPSRKNIMAPTAGRFESVLEEPYLKSSLKKLADSIGDGFKPYHIISRIRELKASNELKTRLLSTFEKAAGSNIFIDFWGDWCGPCMMEMPAYPQLINQFEGKPLKFIFFSANTKDMSVQRVKEKYKIKADFINLTNDEVAMMNNVFEFYSYPAHFVVDKQGYVVGNHTKRAEDIERLITK
ncbi:Thiol-disulfide oxidoreductase ResA [Dyadobacter sp. CECT 9275]|uniref:Thiol-disulfide oxidoreductase ResA n=1 Tax=Dyadobacter helix TaxID=2822344 RepID=A0A916NAJ9_9BACT|nr:TlpA disulfide reductase family protein [Dyadobacter sp. CECT 9275]CAG4988353.1 Thiol-disulfide oxidoreductase ResA [Dyadobacter sp. CECT 9275]